MKKYQLEITEDQALVLFELFNRYDKTGSFHFEHPAEYLALQSLARQIDKTSSSVFEPNYAKLLQDARDCIAEGFDGLVPVNNLKNTPSH